MLFSLFGSYQNLDAVNQLASKEKELVELRALISNKPSEEQKEEDKQEALRKIEELNQQLEVMYLFAVHLGCNCVS